MGHAQLHDPHATAASEAPRHLPEGDDRAPELADEGLPRSSGAARSAQAVHRGVRNPLLERWLARAHPAFPILFFGPVAGASLWAARRTGLFHVLVAALAGWFVFTLFEYVLHRFAMHQRFPRTREGRLRAFLVHGYHHAYPRDRMRLVMPPMISVPLGALLFASYVLVLGRLGLAVFGGTVLGYVVYDETHYLLHHVRPRTALGRWLWRNHMLHHHTNHPSRFGVSSPIWDWVFRTAKAPV